MSTFLIFFPTLSILVFVHELGHFLLAKLFGVGVEEFGLGLPPRLFSRQFRGTVYSLNLLPLGGFVRLRGEDSEVAGFGSRGSFRAKSGSRRALILSGGVLGNFLLSWLLLSIVFFTGEPVLAGQVTVEAVALNSPAATAGIVAGASVESINGEAVETIEELVSKAERLAGSEVALTVRSPGEDLPRELWLVPRVDPPEGEGALGVTVSLRGQLNYEKHPWYQAPVLALKESLTIISVTVAGFFSSLLELIRFRGVSPEITGVVGIYRLTGLAASWGPAIFLQFVAVLGLNLFVFNLLPIPALDGGRLLFVFLEKLARRRISPKVELRLNQMGFAFLGLLFLLITVRDIAGLLG